MPVSRGPVGHSHCKSGRRVRCTTCWHAAQAGGAVFAASKAKFLPYATSLKRDMDRISWFVTLLYSCTYTTQGNTFAQRSDAGLASVWGAEQGPWPPYGVQRKAYQMPTLHPYAGQRKAHAHRARAPKPRTSCAGRLHRASVQRHSVAQRAGRSRGRFVHPRAKCRPQRVLVWSW